TPDAFAASARQAPARQGRPAALLVVLAPGAGLLAAAILLVDRRPCAALGLLVRHPALFVAFLDVLGLALLLVGVGGLVSLAHGGAPGGGVVPTLSACGPSCTERRSEAQPGRRIV